MRHRGTGSVDRGGQVPLQIAFLATCLVAVYPVGRAIAQDVSEPRAGESSESAGPQRSTAGDDRRQRDTLDPVLDLFRSPAARTAARLRAGDADAAARLAPDDEWRGHVALDDGDAEAALQAFERARTEAAADAEARDRLDYNRALAATRAGRFDQAIEGFDALRARRPDDREVAANLDIARRLAELQSRSDRSPDEGGEPGEDAEQGEDGEQGERGQDGERGRDGERGGERDRGRSGEQGREDARGEAGERGRPGDQRDGGVDEPAPPPTGADAEAAQAALDGDGRRPPADGATRRDGRLSESGAPSPDAAPLSEAAQATEQWLQRIPDMPDGLLRRKLELTHRRDYPDVRQPGDAY